MELKPDSKLFIKQLYVLLTVTFSVLLAAVLIQVLVPLNPDADSGEVAVILWPIAGGLLLLMWIISVPIIRLWINNLSFFIEEDRITIHKGILSKIQQNIPFRAITDFRLHRSLYDRFLSIGTIQIQTAGQSRSATGFEGQLTGLLQWGDLLQNLRGKLEKLQPVSQAVGVTEPVQAAPEKNELTLILEELRAIRKTLESKS
ncbi:PH domain-containing protein [candidate division KSB1 bacterium]